MMVCNGPIYTPHLCATCVNQCKQMCCACESFTCVNERKQTTPYQFLLGEAEFSVECLAEFQQEIGGWEI